MYKWATLNAVFVASVSTLAQAQTQPAVHGLWILPGEFKDAGEVMVQKQFAKEGHDFLSAFQKRAAPGFSPVILEGPAVTKANVLSRMKQELDSLTAPGSIFVLYYAGHGIRPSRQTFLAMQSCEVGAPDITHDEAMIMLEQILDLEAEYEGVYFMAYVDACYSGNQSFNADQYLWSEKLGPRGFLLCSSGSDRKSYIPLFSQALTAVYGRDELFKTIQNPSDLLRQTKQANNYPPEQVPHVIPDDCYLQITYPLPGLCFYCVDFGGIINTPVTVKIESASGHAGNFTFNETKGGAPRRYIGSIAFPVQQANQISITLNFTSNYQVPFNVDLSGKPFDSKVLKDIPIPGRTILSSNSPKSRLAAAAADFHSIVQRAKKFGLADSDVVQMCWPLFASTFRQLNPNKSRDFISEQVQFLMASAPTSTDLDGLVVFSEPPSPAEGPNEFVALDKALNFRVLTSKEVATAYAKNLQANVRLLKTDETAAWVKPEELADKLAKASAAAKASKSVEARQVLARTVRDTADPRSRILCKPDYKAAMRMLSF